MHNAVHTYIKIEYSSHKERILDFNDVTKLQNCVFGAFENNL